MQRRPVIALAALSPFASLLLPATAQAATVGQPAPDFTLMDTAGQPVKLSQFKGKPVVLEWNNPGCPFVKKHYQGNMCGWPSTPRATTVATTSHPPSSAAG